MGYSVLVNVLWFLSWKAGRRETNRRLIQKDDNDLGLDVGGEGGEKQTNWRAVRLARNRETGRDYMTSCALFCVL